ncbi:hypothetical protein AMECASPLE_005951 [Ameca splendens]|uniref:Uncharacterized protein n=1 Tax=Ameca splendens TaxID=208324 RepID=A0ABV0XCB5_9TELE
MRDDHGNSGRGPSCNWWVAGLSPAMSVSVVVCLGKTLHPLCLLMVVRGLGGTCVWQAHFCLNGWMTECSVKRFGVSGDLIKLQTGFQKSWDTKQIVNKN